MVTIKKIVVFIGLILLLFGCGNEVDEKPQAITDENDSVEEFEITKEALEERGEFVERYNKIIDNSEENGIYINPEEIEQPEHNDERDVFSQVILNKEGKNITVTYDKEGNLDGYMSSETAEEDLPINLAFVTGSALELETNSFSKALTETITGTETLNSTTYHDGDYKVFMMLGEAEDLNIFSMTISKED